MGLAVLGGLAVVIAAILAALVKQPIGPWSAVLGLATAALVPLALRLAWWVWGYFSMRYEVTRDGLIIHWAGMRQVVPMDDVRRITSGRPFTGNVQGIRWPGYQIGHAQLEAEPGEVTEALVYVTAPPAGQLLLHTSHLVYAVSPADPAAFVEEMKVRRRLGTVQRLNQETLRPRFARLSIWSDSLTLKILLGGLLLNALLFAWTAWRHPGLAPELILQYRFDPIQGLQVPQPARAREAIWNLPTMGLAAIALNGLLALVVHSRARLAASLLAIGAVIMQLAIGIALSRAG
jgi:hypothetical protein